MMNVMELGALVAHVTKPGPDFYRRHYGVGTKPLSITSIEEWRTLPFTTKADLLARPLRERTFLPFSDIDHLRPTSGTSGKGALFCPRTPLRGMEYRLEYHDFKQPMLAFTVPAMPHWHEDFMHRAGGTGGVVVYDPANPAASVKVARDAGVDSISVFAFHMPQLGEHMKRECINENIRFIEMAGEACTKKLFEYLRETFPHATLVPFYGSSEVEDSPIGMPCRAITGEEPLALYHGKGSHYLEIVDPATLEVVEPIRGAEGELVITAYPGEPSAFPLLRFRTGDFVRVIDERCPKHHSWSFTLLGRTEMDFIKIAGGVLRADEIARVLQLFETNVSDRFELHSFERASATGPLLAPTLYVEIVSPIDLHDLSRAIMHELRVAPSFTYEEGVMQGRYLPIVCKPFVPPVGKKSKRIVRH